MGDNEYIPLTEPDLTGNEFEYVSDCIKSNWISSLGAYIAKFENKFGEYCSVKNSVSVFNGTVALHLALASLGIKAGDEVIVPNLTFVATGNSVLYAGAKPVLVDCEPKTWNIDPDKIKEKITNRTKAIIPVHLYGHPCDMSPIMEIAHKNDLFVIEDAAESLGAEYRGQKTGSIGDIGCFSFYGNKTLTTGEGGMCITNDKVFADKMRFLKNQAMSKDKKYWHPEVGYNYRMTNIQAAIGVAQLERIEKFIEIKRQNADLYSKLLKEVNGVATPIEEDYAKNVYWMYSVLLDDSYRLKREELIKKLEEEKIESRPLFYPLSTMPTFKSEEKFPVSNNISGRGISLPSGVTLTSNDIIKVVETIKKFSS